MAITLISLQVIMPFPSYKVFFKHLKYSATPFLWIILGAFLAAIAIESFFIPNGLIDGGVIGIALMMASITSINYFPFFAIFLHLPFLYMAYRYMNMLFLWHMCFAILCFATFCFSLHGKYAFITQETIEIIVIGGALLGTGVGLIIRMGGSLDGTEILAIILSKKKPFTIGQIILFFNIFIFGAFAFMAQNMHSALKSLIAYIITVHVIDMIVLGSDEMKSVTVISEHPKKLAKVIINELHLGLTFMYGRRGVSQKDQEILYVVVERLRLAELKEVVHKEDPRAFLAVQTLHEVVKHKYSPTL